MSVGGWMSEWVSEWVSGWVSMWLSEFWVRFEWVSAWESGWKTEYVCVSEFWVNGWVSVWVSSEKSYGMPCSNCMPLNTFVPPLFSHIPFCCHLVGHLSPTFSPHIFRMDHWMETVATYWQAAARQRLFAIVLDCILNGRKLKAPADGQPESSRPSQFGFFLVRMVANPVLMVLSGQSRNPYSRPSQPSWLQRASRGRGSLVTNATWQPKPLEALLVGNGREPCLELTKITGSWTTHTRPILLRVKKK